MALTATTNVTATNADTHAVIKAVLDELQLLKRFLKTPTTGAQVTATTAIAVTGVSANAVVISAFKIKDNTVVTGALATDITSDVTVGADSITCATTAFDANEQLDVLVWNKA